MMMLSRCVQILALIFFFHSVTWTLNKVTPESDYTLKVQEFYLQRLFDWAKKQIVKQIHWH